MIRKIAVSAVGAIMLGCMPAYGQELPELDGAPPPLNIPKPSVTPKPTPKPPPKAVTPAAKPKVSQPVVADRTKAEEARLAALAAQQKAEQARLEKRAADLEARAAELAAKERRFAEQSASERAELAAQQAELARQSDEVARQLAAASKPAPQVAVREPEPVPAPVLEPSERRVAPRYNVADVDFETARRSCTRAGLREARERDFYSAWYDRAPRLYDEGRTLELRGYMRLEDRRGYVVVDTVCEVDADGEARDFAFLR